MLISNKIHYFRNFYRQNDMNGVIPYKFMQI